MLAAAALFFTGLPAQDPPRLCRTVHGRLYVANGTPAVRIWVIGTKRVLGVPATDGSDMPHLPRNVQRRWRGTSDSAFYSDVYGDFRVCAWKPQRPGEMQRVRVVSAQNLVIQRR